MVHPNQKQIKKFAGTFGRVIQFTTVMLAMAIGVSSASADVLDPNKDYSEARSLVGQTQGVSPVSNVRKATVPAPKTASEWIAATVDSASRTAKAVLSSLSQSLFGKNPSPVAANVPTEVRAPASSTTANSSERPKTIAAPVAVDMMSFPGLSRSENGVVSYDLAPETDAVPRLRIPAEPRFSSTHFALDSRAQKTLEAKIFAPLQSPEVMDASELQALTRAPVPVGPIKKVKDVTVQRGKIDSAVLAKLVLKLAPEVELKLGNFVGLTDEETQFLSGLLLYQSDQCASAVGLFHSISGKKEWQAEADFYLATCSKRLGLMTDFSERVRRVFLSGDGHYSRRLLKEVDWNTPNVTSRIFGEALLKAMGNPEVVKEQTPVTLATAAALIAESSAAAEKFKTALEWSKKVPENHPRYLQAKFVEALSEYQIGSKKRALELQEGLIKLPRAEESAREFQGLIALNLARMYFQEQKYKEAHQAFLTVNKDHPLWLQGLAEMGWAQLMSSDYEGAIGNMYSIHSPFFAAAYKPESYVIRTIGYLHLCQYGDAYRALTILEKEYRGMLTSVDKYTKAVPGLQDGRYGTVRRFLQSFNRRDKTDINEVDGLPSPIIREIARQKDFLNLQKSLNRQIDERAIYTKLDADVSRGLKGAQNSVNQTRRRIQTLRKNIASIRAKPLLEQHRNEWKAELDSELSRLNGQFFFVDLYNEAQRAMSVYSREVIAGADRRRDETKSKMEQVVANRLLKIRTDLSRYMDNNELLRYEVFSASGENIRYQVAGGEKSNRIPASAIPKAKSLQWDFDGEYWEDEIGHYRSGLKNNCPMNSEGKRESASLSGGPNDGIKN